MSRSRAKYELQKEQYAVIPEARECVIIDGEFYGVCANIRYKRTPAGRWLRQLDRAWVGVRSDCVPVTLKTAYNTTAAIAQDKPQRSKPQLLRR